MRVTPCELVATAPPRSNYICRSVRPRPFITTSGSYHCDQRPSLLPLAANSDEVTPCELVATALPRSNYICRSVRPRPFITTSGS
ncbi:hypothetical protein J6590_078077 [Homalodisca vitripennis]|nr:hypothetical protein J6590_078077 [Homalodisca vitripennis]